jgi:hypothetical protein
METLNKTSLFWDVGSLDPHRDADFIIGRILRYGDTDDFTWALSTYGRDKVEAVLRRTKDLDRKSLSFWCGFFHIDPSTCILAQSISQPSAFSAR